MDYETGVLIGRGGTGEVLKSWDPKLERYVALKLLHTSDPQWTRRLMREARAQASLDHPAIAKVYAVGDLDGRPFIAMQLIEGRPLQLAAADMGLEQKVRVMSRVVRAVHAAHAEGLVHRDLKPGNILIEEADDGPRPFVVDFGLVQAHQATSLTLSGQVLGTPAYMAPEQAAGDTAKVDRRSDVYSLGVILYELLVGRPPFLGEQTLEVLLQVLRDEPRPPRRLDPSVPIDLEIIALRCLEKERQRRYRSALALAEDLDRWLAGEPIEASPTSILRRWSRRVRRHRAAVSVGAVGLSVSLLVTAITINDRFTNRRRIQAARHFGQEVESIESLLQRAHLVPSHDIRPELASVRKRLAKLTSELDQHDSTSRAIGQFALGRGYLGLGELEEARHYLEAAWQAGFRERQAAYALGEVLARQYRAGLSELASLRNPTLREKRRAALELELIEPAVSYLEKSRGGTEHPEYLEASLAFFAGRVEPALDKLRSLAKHSPAFYEGDLLAAEIHAELFRRETISGGSSSADDSSFEAARRAFLAAAEVGESDPRPWEGLCDLWLHAVRARFHGESHRMSEARDRAREACNSALEIHPERAGPYLRLARIARYTADQAVAEGRLDVEALQRLHFHAEQSLEVDPSLADAHVLSGVGHRIEALFELEHGEDPTASLRAAIDAYRRAIELDPGLYSAHISLASAQLYLGDHVAGHGDDPTEIFWRAADESKLATELEPDLIAGYVNLGIARGQLANWNREHGRLARPLYVGAIEVLRRSIEINPDFVTAHLNLAATLIGGAQLELKTGGNAEASLDEAETLLAEYIKTNPTFAQAHSLRSLIAALRGDYERRHGRNPRPWIDSARVHRDHAVRIRRDDRLAWVAGSEALWVEARWRFDRSEDPVASIRDGLSMVETALAIDSQDAALHVRKAQFLTLAARWKHANGANPAADLDAAGASAGRGQELTQHDAAAPAVAAEIFRWRAAWARPDSSQRRQAIERGMASAATAVTIDPQRAEALVQRAALQWIVAQSFTGEPRQQQLASAKSDWLAALTIDPWIRDPISEHMESLIPTEM